MRQAVERPDIFSVSHNLHPPLWPGLCVRARPAGYWRPARLSARVLSGVGGPAPAPASLPRPGTLPPRQVP